MSTPRRLALVQPGSAGWIAGLLYVQNVVRALRLLPPAEQPELVLLSPGPLPAGAEDDALPAERRETGPDPRQIARVATEVGADVVFPLLRPLRRRARPRWIGWIPDFQHRRRPEFFSLRDRLRRDRAFRALAAHAPRLVVSSENAREDLFRWYDADPARVRVLPFRTLASDAWYAADPRESLRRHGLPERFLVFPSQFWLHKNHRVAFEAVKLLRDGGLDVTLVCTGATEDARHPHHFRGEQEWLERAGLDSAVRILGLLPRREQVQLLRAAAAVVQPSLFEGWSMLVEDARALGKRLYVSDLPVHREQDPRDAAFFDPADANALAGLVAADWERLEPGPRPELEQAARRRQEELGAEFGRAVLSLVEEAAA